MDHNQELTDINIPFDDRVKKALRLIENPETIQSIPNCISWIGYRFLEDKIPYETISSVLKTKYKIEDIPLSLRWEMSLSILEIYIDIKIDKFDESKCKIINDIWINKNIRTLWAPQVLNYLRGSFLYAYKCYLNGDNEEASKISFNCIDQWRISTSSFDLFLYPLRFTEMRDDIRCLQMFSYILRACGKISFEDYKWMNQALINEKYEFEQFFYKAVRIIGKDNERSLWKI